MTVNGYTYTVRQNERTGLWEVVETRNSGNRPFTILKACRTKAEAGKILHLIQEGGDFKEILK